MKRKTYTVLVDDNFHFMDESERYRSGQYDSLSKAIAHCKMIIDDFLISALEPNITAEELYSSYTMFGEDPYIPESDKSFSAWEYAESRSKELTQE